MVFKSEKELKRFILKKSRLALLKAQDEVYKIIKQFIYKYYADYDPSFYDRTYQLLSSLVESRIVSDGKGYRAEVYFALDKLSYSQYAWQGGHPPSGEEVFEAAKSGLHGAIGDAGGGWQYLYINGNSGVNIWSDPIQELDAKAIDILKKMLISEGIPIK